MVTAFWCQATCWLVKCVSQETIPFPFTSWRTRAPKLVAGMCKKTNAGGLWWNQHFHMFGKYVSMFWKQKTDLSSVATGPALAGCDGGCVAKTDLDVWAAQCCWLSVSRCRTEETDFAGKWARVPTAFFKQEKSIAVHAN